MRWKARRLPFDACGTFVSAERRDRVSANSKNPVLERRGLYCFTLENRTDKFGRLNANGQVSPSPLLSFLRSLPFTLPPFPFSPRLFFAWNSFQASCEITLQREQCNGAVTEISADAKTVIPAHVAQLLVLMRLGACGLNVSNLPPTLRDWDVRRGDDPFARRERDWSDGHARKFLAWFSCARGKLTAGQWNVVHLRLNTRSRGTWSLTVTKWKSEWESWRRCNRESGITSGDDHKIRNYPLTLVPTVGERGTSAPAGVFRK